MGNAHRSNPEAFLERFFCRCHYSRDDVFAGQEDAVDDSTYAIFIVFGLIWTVMGAVGLVALLKADGQKIRLGKWGLLVAIPTFLPLILALGFAVWQRSL